MPYFPHLLSFVVFHDTTDVLKIHLYLYPDIQKYLAFLLLIDKIELEVVSSAFKLGTSAQWNASYISYILDYTKLIIQEAGLIKLPMKYRAYYEWQGTCLINLRSYDFKSAACDWYWVCCCWDLECLNLVHYTQILI